MRIKNIEFEGKGIFHYIHEVTGLEFLDIETVNYLDDILIFSNGNREVSPLVENVLIEGLNELSMSKLGHLMGMMFSKKWENNHEYLLEKVPVETTNMSVKEIITREGTNTNTTTANNKTENVNSVSGYNEVDMVEVESDGTTDNNSLAFDGTDSGVTTRETITKGNRDNVIDDIDKGMSFLTNNQLYDIMILDISKQLGTLIY